MASLNRELTKTLRPTLSSGLPFSDFNEAPQCSLTNESTLGRWMLVKEEVLAGSISTAEA